MFRVRSASREYQGGFPRIRGDVPCGVTANRASRKFSPHTRGCSSFADSSPPSWSVFPAYAGMFRRQNRVRPSIRSFPRIRGDVPQQSNKRLTRLWFSPHTRGCSSTQALNLESHTVFPAYAGMFRRFCLRLVGRTSFPRIRGDVPVFPQPKAFANWFSPHTRGCSAVGQ